MTGEVALSLANAELGSAGDLEGWLRGDGAGNENASEVCLRLPEFLDLRACIRELLAAAAERRPLPHDAVERLNETSARVPRVARLGETGVIQSPAGAGPAPLVLARVAWSGMELLGGADRGRIRRCDACGRFFVTTRPDRVWCSDRCGNRVRVARHHARLRDPSYAARG